MLVARFQFLLIAAQPEIQVSLGAAGELLKDIALKDDFDDGRVTHLDPQHHCLVEGHFPFVYPGEDLLEGFDLVQQVLVPVGLGEFDAQVRAEAIYVGAFQKRGVGGPAQQLIYIGGVRL